MSSEGTGSGGVATRSRFWWLRWLLLAIVLVILAAEIVLISPSLEEAWHRIGDLDWVWILASIGAALLSMDSFAQVQRALLRSAGVRVTQWQSLSVILASNSVSQTMPGGPVLSPAFVYRETRKWGATPVVASWQVVMSGLLAGVGLAVLGFGGALLAGAKTSPFSVFFSVVGFVAVAVVFQYLASHPESLQSTVLRIVEWTNQVRNKPRDHGHGRVIETLEQLRAVQLTQRDLGISFGWSLFNWVTDVACLAFACWAVGAHPSIAGLMVAYAAGKAVGTAVPLLPGGIGVVDAVLVPALTSAGMPAADAITAVLVYRLISYVFIAAIGWVVVLVMFRNSFKQGDSLEDEIDDDVSEDGPDDRPADPEDKPDGDPPDNAADDTADTVDDTADMNDADMNDADTDGGRDGEPESSRRPDDPLP